MSKEVSFYVIGKVQDIMFRQTFIRGAQKLKLKAGATNIKDNKNRVDCSLSGTEQDISLLIENLRKLDPLNSWGARVQELHIMEDYQPFSNHEVTSENVDSFNWEEDIEMYL